MRISDFYPQLDDFLMKMNGVEKDFKAEWGWTRYKVGGKSFCNLCGEDCDFTLITVKCEPDFNMSVREEYPDKIIPGYYCNKQHWNSVKVQCGVPHELIQEMCVRGYNLVLHSLPKKKQLEILEKANEKSD